VPRRFYPSVTGEQELRLKTGKNNSVREEQTARGLAPPTRNRAPIRHFDRALRDGEREMTRIAENHLNRR
jgi:hypothetical protein